MFSSRIQLRKRTPENGTDREKFLSLLVDEYLNSNTYDAKCQVLANLANFGYDPLNYDYIRRVGVLDVFLHVLKNETNNKQLRFACAGICNTCLDPLNAEYILEKGGLPSIVQLLKSTCGEIIADSITILIYLYNTQIASEITTAEVNQLMNEIINRKDKRISNLATLFLENVGESR